MTSSLPKEKHDHKALIFPEGFLWGAATSAIQVEGGNMHSDWASYKTSPGKAADQYHLYEEDFQLAKELGHNSHRLGIEWSRIEPEEGQFDEAEIQHYIKELKFLKSLNVKVFLTLWHFSIPDWLAKKDGWTNFKAPYYFERFVKKVAPELSEYVDFWVTINEPGIYVFMAYMGGDPSGQFPPAKKNNLQAGLATLNLARAHKKVYRFLKNLNQHKPVGIAQNVQSFSTYHKHSIVEQIAAGLSDMVANHSFYMLTKGYHDYIGVNYYFNYRYDLKRGVIPEITNPKHEARDVSDLGWEIYPEGIFDVLTDMSDGLPIYITECGIASTNDDRRTRFLITYLQEVFRAIEAGVKVKGFFYWSLIDNFELHRGFDPRFGLIEVDYATQARKVRSSAYVYKEIIKQNGIPHDLLKLLGHGIKVKDVLKEQIKE